ESDAWGRRFSYRPTATFTNSATRVTLASQGNLTVLSAAGGNSVASFVPAIVVSHGANGNGAHTGLGTQLAVGADPDELENQVVLVTSAWTDGGVVRTFVKRSTPTPGYDDEVVWLPPGLFFNRMLSAGKLP
ncbi:MAG: prepilin-type cleavage/methylation domain-containing protein, partial [Candidatus Accumulibacter sp.]|nr:prepilin-type cleavage/methylation domain-containing protein [Accumulibacter sp.]